MWLALYIFAILVLFFSTSILWSELVGAIWVPTPWVTVHDMLKLAEVGPDDLVYDLGCGDGRILIAAARDYGARGVGIEIDPLRYLWSKLMVARWGVGDRVEIVFGNFFNLDTRPATVVTCYLRPKTNVKLEGKLLSELRPGTRVVSNTFIFPTIPAVSGDYTVRLYLFYPDKYQGLRQSISELQD